MDSVQTEQTSDRVPSRMPEPAGRVLVADDEASFRGPIVELLRGEGFDCVTAEDADSALAQIAETEFDAILVDIRMPGNDDLEMLTRLRERGSDAAIIVITGFPSVETAVRSLNLGVCGYLIKPFEFKEVLEILERSIAEVRAIRQLQLIGPKRLGQSVAALGGTDPSASTAHSPTPREEPLSANVEGALGGVIDELIELKQTLKQRDEQVSSPRHALPRVTEIASLSTREHEILTAFSDGDRVSNIAANLFISPHTVRNHLKSIFRKLGVGSQAELVVWLKSMRQNG